MVGEAVTASVWGPRGAGRRRGVLQTGALALGGSVCLPGGRWGRGARSERVPVGPPQSSSRKPCGGPSTVGRVTVTTGDEQTRELPGP